MGSKGGEVSERVTQQLCEKAARPKVFEKVPLEEPAPGLGGGQSKQGKVLLTL